jgi:hypothetical protein
VHFQPNRGIDQQNQQDCLTKQAFEEQNLAHSQQQWMRRIAGDVLPAER